MNKRRGTVSESNFLVVFDEDLDDLGSRLRQTIPSEVAAENYRRSVFHQRMPVGFHPEHFITFQSMSHLPTGILNLYNAVYRTTYKANTTIISYHKP